MTKKPETTEKIINAAISLFILKGVDGATMESIAENASVSKKTLYKYFPGKELIMETITDNFLDNIVNLSTVKYSNSLDFKIHLREVIRSRVKAFTSEEYIESAKLIVTEMMKGANFTEEQINKFASFEESFKNWIEDAQRDGKITNSLDSEKINKQFHSLLKGEVYYPVLYGMKENTKENMLVALEDLYTAFIKFYCEN